MISEEIGLNDYLAENGMYVATTSAESGSVLPMIRVVDWGVRPAPGTQLVSEGFLKRMDETERILTQEFGHTITQRTIYPLACTGENGEPIHDTGEVNIVPTFQER